MDVDMFLEIKSHAGVFIAEALDATAPAAYIPVKPLSEAWLQNLDRIQKIYPAFVGPLNDDFGSNDKFGDIWSDLEGASSLGFHPVWDDGGTEPFTLVFTKEGMGEYQRIKRVILGD